MHLPFLPNPFPGLTRPVPTPIWNEAGVALELANLLRSRVFHGEGVLPGEGRPVMLVPGFLAGDATLSVMTQWLRRMGYRTSRAGMRANVDCSQRTLDRIEERAERLADRTGERVAVVGQSRGGTLARALAVSRPDLVASVIGLGAPLRTMLSVNPLVYAHVAAVAFLGTGRVPGLFSTNCWAGDCCSRFRDALECEFPSDDVHFVSVFSKRDGIVDWNACLDPAAEHVEVRSSHCGMAVDAATYRAIGSALPSAWDDPGRAQPAALPLAA